MSCREREASQNPGRWFAAWSDEALAARAVGGRDEPACGEIYRRYRKRVYLWCHRYTHDRDEAVDCAQEVFVRVFRGLGDFQRDAKLSTWIYTIARNYCLSLLSRRGRRWRERMETLDGCDVADSLPETQRQALEHAESLQRLLAMASHHMAPRELEAFILHYREGLTVKEITRTLECENLTGARALIQNARRKFRRLIDRKELTNE